MLGSCQTCILLNDFTADMMGRLMLKFLAERNFLSNPSNKGGCKRMYTESSTVYQRWSENLPVFCVHAGLSFKKTCCVLSGITWTSLTWPNAFGPIISSLSSWVSLTSSPPRSPSSKSWKNTSGFVVLSRRKLGDIESFTSRVFKKINLIVLGGNQQNMILPHI